MAGPRAWVHADPGICGEGLSRGHPEGQGVFPEDGVDAESSGSTGGLCREHSLRHLPPTQPRSFHGAGAPGSLVLAHDTE